MQRSCSVCKDSIIPYLKFNGNENIKYYKWVTKKEEITVKGKPKTVSHTIKEELQSTVVDLIAVFPAEILKYMHHEGIAIHQFQEIDYLKRRLNTNEMLIHCDFSQNYESKYETEIQSFHFGRSRKQYTLHTVEVYYKKDMYSQVTSKSLCSLSECNDHSDAAIWAHLELVFRFAKENCPQVEILHFLSDTPSTQYRNRTLFYLFCNGLRFTFPIKVATWNYYAPGHGKGAADGIGGTLKRTADSVVTQGVDIASFQDFVTTLQAHIRNINLYVVHEDKISTVKALIPSKLPAFKGTMSVHQLVYSEKTSNELLMKCLSCLKCLECKKFEFGSLVYANREKSKSSSEEDETVESLPLQVQLSDAENDPSDCATASTSSGKLGGEIADAVLKPNTFLLVQFQCAHSARKNYTLYRYVCRIIQDLDVQGFRSFQMSKKEFTLRVKDECKIEKKDILEILLAPDEKIVKRKVVFVFPKSVDIHEK